VIISLGIALLVKLWRARTKASWQWGCELQHLAAVMFHTVFF
jgi:hypothetical protein